MLAYQKSAWVSYTYFLKEKSVEFYCTPWAIRIFFIITFKGTFLTENKGEAWQVVKNVGQEAGNVAAVSL